MGEGWGPHDKLHGPELLLSMSIGTSSSHTKAVKWETAIVGKGAFARNFCGRDFESCKV